MNCKSILEDCGIGRVSTQEFIENLKGLETSYDTDKLILLFNYCLQNIKDTEILKYLLKIYACNDCRNNSTFEILSDILKFNDFNNKDVFEEWIEIKRLSVKAITAYKDTLTLKVLLDCLNNKKEHYKVRLACADALGKIGNKYAVRPLLDILEDEDEKSIYLKESTTCALGLLGDSSAIDPLISILESKHGAMDKFTFLKEKIIEALGRLNFNNRKILEALKKSLMDSSPIVRINAIEAIMNSGDDDAIVFIRPSLNDEDDEVKRNALIALYNLKGRDILDEILNLPVYSQVLKNEAQELIEEYEDDEEDDVE